MPLRLSHQRMKSRIFVYIGKMVRAVYIVNHDREYLQMMTYYGWWRYNGLLHAPLLFSPLIACGDEI